MLPMASCRREILLFSKGVNDTENGSYKFTDLSAKLIQKEIDRRQIRYFSDWGHASLDEDPKSKREAGAASSHYDLELRNGDLWACNIDWTPEGADDLLQQEIHVHQPGLRHERQGRGCLVPEFYPN